MCRSSAVVRLAAVLLTLRFPANLGLFFCGVAGFFEDLWVACFWNCFCWNLLVFCIFLFYGLLFFKFYGTFVVWIYCKKHMGRVFVKICSFWAIFFICNRDSIFDFLANSSYCLIFLPTHFGLVFQLNYLFSACFSNLLACSWKITWHHWLAVVEFVSAPQHETSYDPETTTKEDFNCLMQQKRSSWKHWRVHEEANVVGH